MGGVEQAFLMPNAWLRLWVSAAGVSFVKRSISAFFRMGWVLSLMLAGNVVCHAAQLQLKYLGAAGWEMKSGGLVVLVDPYISRIKYGAGRDVKDDRKRFADSDLLASDTKLIDALVTKADYILIHHAHPDHILDVPYIAKKTGARVLGTATSINILRAYGVAEEQLYTVQGGEDYQFDGFSVRVVPSLHSALVEKRYSDTRRHGSDLKAPLRLLDLIEGGSLMFLCRFPGREVLTMGSMNFIEKELQGLQPEILLAGAGTSRSEIYKYTERLLTLTGLPRIVIPTHWDNFYVTYDDEAAQLQAWEEKGRPFMQEAAAASRKSKLIRPRHLQPIIIDADAESRQD